MQETGASAHVDAPGACMSVAGNLADLTLSELLQTIALSRKSGVLEICSEHEIAWLGLRDGQIVRVALSDTNLCREKVLDRAGLDETAPGDSVEACLWEASVNAVLRLFEWRTGEFTFNPDQDPEQTWRGPEGLLLPTSLSPEFLALEGARQEDEGAFHGEVSHLIDEIDVPQLRSDVQTEQGGGSSEAREHAAEDLATRAPPDRSAANAGGTDSAAAERSPGEERVEEPALERATPSVVIAVDPALDLLEVIKRSLARWGVSVHIFQQPQDALERVKHYLVRGEVPAIVVGGEIGKFDGTRGGWANFATRVRRMVPKVRIVVLGAPRVPDSGPADAALPRLDLQRASQAERDDFLQRVGEALGLRERR